MTGNPFISSFSSRMGDFFIISILVVVLIATLFPVLHIVSVSLSDDSEVWKNAVTIFPRKPEIDAYKIIIKSPTIPRSYKWAIIYTTVGTFINLWMTALMAYPLSKKRLAFRKFITVLIIITFFFSGGLIPTFLLIKKLGMYGTMWALVIPGAIATWNLIILRTFFQGLPEELEDSVFVDGGNDWTFFIRIALPLSKAALAVITLFYAVGHWNSWFPAVIYLDDPTKWPLQVILRQIVIMGAMTEELFAQGKVQEVLRAEEGIGYICVDKIKYATLFASILPMLIIYPFIQKYFVKGIMIGSLKG